MKTTDTNHDFAGLPTSRVFSNFLRWKVIPFGFLEQGPGIVWLISIWLRHKFGRRLAWFQIKHKKQYDRVIFVLGRVRHKLNQLLGRS